MALSIEHITAIDAAQSGELTINALMDIALSHGIQHLIYLKFSPMRDSEQGATYVAHRGYENSPLIPTAVEAVIKSEDGYHIIQRRIADCHRPYFRQSDYFLNIATAVGYDRMLEGVKLPEGDVLCIPVYGARNQTGTFLLNSNNAQNDNALAAYLQVLCQAAHHRICELETVSKDAEIVLTARESDVLKWLVLGKSNTDIGAILNLSRHTVDAYIRRIFMKLGVNDRVSAAVKASTSGLLHQASDALFSNNADYAVPAKTGG